MAAHPSPAQPIPDGPSPAHSAAGRRHVGAGLASHDGLRFRDGASHQAQSAYTVIARPQHVVILLTSPAGFSLASTDAAPWLYRSPLCYYAAPRPCYYDAALQVTRGEKPLAVGLETGFYQGRSVAAPALNNVSGIPALNNVNGGFVMGLAAAARRVWHAIAINEVRR